MKKINENFVPQSVEEAINHLFESLPDDVKERLKKENFAHHGFGTGIRNSWNLWEEGTPFKLDFKKRFGLWGMGDDCSGIIFAGVKAKVKGENVENVLNKTAESYKKHWLQHGVEPSTGKEIPNFKKKKIFRFKIDKDDYIDYI